MITLKCIDKIRDNSGKICGYTLQDLNGDTKTVASESLKRAIVNKQVDVINLRITSDNRLVSTSRKQLANNKIFRKEDESILKSNSDKHIKEETIASDINYEVRGYTVRPDYDQRKEANFLKNLVNAGFKYVGTKDVSHMHKIIVQFQGVFSTNTSFIELLINGDRTTVKFIRDLKEVQCIEIPTSKTGIKMIINKICNE